MPEQCFTVRWEVDVHASSAQDAAREAHEIMRDIVFSSGRTPNIFTVTDERGLAVEIDATQ
jgi:hypothetical protein